MFKYTFYRVLQLIPVWILLSIVVFAIVHALPGDAIDALVPPDAASNPATRAALEKELGLDKPIYVQYLKWLERIVLHGDFGRSITTRRTISVEIFKRLPATIYLAVTAVLVSLLLPSRSGPLPRSNAAPRGLYGHCYSAARGLCARILARYHVHTVLFALSRLAPSLRVPQPI